MEFIVYFDSELTNSQRVVTQHDCKVKPSELAQSVFPNYYAVSVDGGHIRKNPHHDSSDTLLLIKRTHLEPEPEPEPSL